MKIQVNGVPVIFSLKLVTEPSDGWTGTRYIGTYETLDELNKAINAIEVPLYWMLEVDLEDVDNE